MKTVFDTFCREQDPTFLSLVSLKLQSFVIEILQIKVLLYYGLGKIHNIPFLRTSCCQKTSLLGRCWKNRNNGAYCGVPKVFVSLKSIILVPGSFSVWFLHCFSQWLAITYSYSFFLMSLFVNRLVKKITCGSRVFCSFFVNLKSYILEAMRKRKMYCSWKLQELDHFLFTLVLQYQ